MATCAFLFAPRRAIPSRDPSWADTIQSWTLASDERWSELVEALPDDEQELVPHFLVGTSLSRNLAAATRTGDPQLRASARAWTDAAWKTWNEGGREGPLPDNGVVTAHHALGVDSRASVEDLTSHRGGYKPIAAKKLPRGVTAGVLGTARDDNDYDFVARDSTERVIFEEIVRAHGGEALAIWTFGHAVHVLVARSPAPGAPPVVFGPLSFRTRSKSRAPALERLRAALESSTWGVDFGAIERELRAPALSLGAFFAAFGVVDVKELPPIDAEALWRDLELVRGQVLEGATVDGKAATRVNDAIERFGVKLPKKKPAKGDPRAAFAAATFALACAVGACGRPQPAEPPPTDDDGRYRSGRRARVLAMLSTMSSSERPAVRVDDWMALVERLGNRLRYVGSLSEVAGGLIAFRVSAPEAGPEGLSELRADLQGKGVVDGYGEVWIDGHSVVGAMCSDLDTALVAALLADVPPDTTLEVGIGPDVRAAFVR